MIGWWIGQPFYLMFVDQSNGALAQNFHHLKVSFVNKEWADSKGSSQHLLRGLSEQQPS